MLKEWVIVPGCEVLLSVDGAEPVEIGYRGIGDALKGRIEADGYSVSERVDAPENHEVRVVEVDVPGIDLAFATRWSSHFQEWSLLPVSKRDGEPLAPLGTAVEGIRVEQGTPGYADVAFFAMANATGLSAPRTDVSRSGLEQTPERLELLRSVYTEFAGFVAKEVEELRARGFSLTWSAQEATFLTAPLLGGRAEDGIRLDEAVASIPSVVVDDGSERRLLRPAEVESLPIFWTVESNFFRSAESLLREMPSTASVTALTDALGVEAFQVPEGPLVTSASADRGSVQFLRSREVSRIIIDKKQRRVDLAWEEATEDPRWLRLVDARILRSGHISSLRRYGGSRVGSNLLVGRANVVDVSGRESQTAVRAHGLVMILPDSALAGFLVRTLESCKGIDGDLANEVRLCASAGADGILSQRSDSQIERSNAAEFLETLECSAEVAAHLDLDRFAEAISAEPIRIFDPWAWDRGSSG